MPHVVLITGASSGIGFATAQRLLKDGHIVYGTARTEEDLRRIEGAGAHPLRAEMADGATLEAAVATVLREQGRIDVLFNNAGYGLYGTVEETSIADAKEQFEANMFGLARITQLVLPHMRAARSGTIICTSSMGGRIFTPMGAWYHASKHALEGWADCLRVEVAPFGIRVVLIEPGAIQTPWGMKVADAIERISGNGPYAALARRTARNMRKSYAAPGRLSPPSVVADAVARVIGSRHPKRRYVVGKYGLILILIRRYLGDAVFERLITRVM